MKASIASRVRKGAKLLDKHIPGWRAQIKVETLNLASADYCIVGQLGWWEPLKKMGLDCAGPDTLAQYGFEVPKKYYTMADQSHHKSMKQKKQALFERLQIEWMRHLPTNFS